MSGPRVAWLLLAAWIAGVISLGVWVQSELVVGSDLRLFLPRATTREQGLLLDEIGEGPAARALVVALEGAPPERLAEASRALVESLSASSEFRWAANGDVPLESFPEDLLPYRFLLSPTIDSRELDAEYLHGELVKRARDLSSPAGLVLEPLLPRDPTLEVLALVQRWQPAQEPRRQFDVWFDRSGRRALLIAETVAPAFDPGGQRAALAELERALRGAGADGIAMTVSGTGYFSVLMEARTRAEIGWLGTATTIAMLVLLLVAYRRVGSLLYSALPLLSAGVVGLAAVSAIFGSVHGITLAFGFTLIGVAQDYPLHLLSHRHAGITAIETARRLWPALATGVASTCIAYFTFFFSGVLGLAQLACFTVSGLAVAGLTTRFVLPHVLGAGAPDYGASVLLGRLWTAIAGLPRLRWAGVALLGGCALAFFAARQPFWENDLGKLTPVPTDLLEKDRELRAELGTPDLRYLLVLDAVDAPDALARLEQLDPALVSLVGTGAIAGYDDAARYVPSPATQRARQARLPDATALRAALAEAQLDTPFRPDVFEPFIADVERARVAPVLTLERAAATPLGARLGILLKSVDGETRALVTFTGVRDPAALRALADSDGAIFLDLKEASETLVAGERARILVSLAIAALLLLAVVSVALRSPARTLRVLAPMALTTVVVLAVLRATGVSLNLFHLISLVLVAGLGLDYALFFEHAADDASEQRRTLHAVLVCSLSTLMVFALLAISDLPVLRAVGLPVTIGVVSNFALALLLTRPDARLESHVAVHRGPAKTKARR